MNNNLNIDVNMAYMRGAENRINMILNGRYDFCRCFKNSQHLNIKNIMNLLKSLLSLDPVVF